jgi:two-component system, OmpR family, sensor kinase
VQRLNNLPRRLPIRLKLTLLFTFVMGVLLTALSGFLYLHFRSDLDYNINESLRGRAQEIVSLVRGVDIEQDHSDYDPLPGRGEDFVQILDRSGRVLAASAGFEHPALLTHREISQAAGRSLLLQRQQSSRLFSMPINHGSAIVVAGVLLAERDAALDKLDNALVTGGPVALLLASIAAYGLAAAALRPVESMRQRAATISSGEIGARLPLPESIDEIHRLGSTLNEMLDRLHDGLERERAFVANASHELRMPLTVLKAELEVALRENGDTHQLRLALASAAEEADRIIRLAEDLLVLARAEQGQLPIQLRTVTLRDLLWTLGERLRPVAEYAVNAPSGSSDGDEVIVEVDLDRLGQALGNLLDNAHRYGDGAIHFDVTADERFLQLHVTDEGPGFSVDFLPRAFERFSRQDPARSRGGAGLGLAIVRMIAEAHHGGAHAANLSDGGADVWLSIPRTQRGG